jgi:vacuolar-type H+-ATPase subunit F/Vma7
MTPLVLGTRADVVGFALAGVAGTICTTVDDVERAFTDFTGEEIVILSATAALLAADHIAEAEKSGRGPLFVVLPSR